uniref:Uncharacterized protein n=1 Tax=Anguilla anguilla TaxID=7936 RepID=A0A0E9QZF0_ANGAN
MKIRHRLDRLNSSTVRPQIQTVPHMESAEMSMAEGTDSKQGQNL